MTHRPLILMLLCALGLGVQSCSWYDNQTTYFNTYYNIRRIMTEVEDEFAYQDENKRVKPRVLVPAMDGFVQKSETAPGNAMTFLKAFVIERSKLQPMATKVDSILIKGSKILANHPKSDFVEGTLFHMSKSYFFRSEWVASQQKCVEMVEKFPDGEYSPDGHLLLAKNYLMQRKISQGVTALSKCVDVAWYKERYDILSEAYRIQAEMAIENGDLDKAVQPYKQAVAQSEDGEQRARWQVDVAGIYYRVGKFDLAEKAFAEVLDYTPDALATFESKLYRAASLTRLGRLDEAEQLFAELENNRSYEEWGSFVAAERIALERARKGELDDPAILARERQADTTYVGRPELLAQNFQKGMELFKQDKYEEALPYFAKAKVIRTPVFDVANKYFTLIKQWEDQHRKVRSLAFVDKAEMRDSVARQRAREIFALGRVHEQFGKTDSAMFYYRLAADSTSADDTERSRYLFAQARLIRPADPDAADSLLEIISERYPTSPYGRQASGDLGFSSDVVIDDAAELYKSATSFRLIKDYGMAASRYNAIVRDHSTSPFAPKALYALGWMHERETGMQDSAMYYYSELVDKYPRSEHAKEIRPSLEFALAKINGVEVQDSLLLRDLDKDLLEKAKAGERDAMQQLMDNNRDVLNPNMPNLPGLNVPGLNVPGLNNPGGTPPGNLPPGNLPPGSVPPGSVPGGKGVPGGGVKPMQDGTPPADTSGAKRP